MSESGQQRPVLIAAECVCCCPESGHLSWVYENMRPYALVITHRCVGGFPPPPGRLGVLSKGSGAARRAQIPDLIITN